jgi:lactoylglutathione lyase
LQLRTPGREAAGALGGGAMAKAIHYMIRVLDEARSLAFYEKAFELKVADRLEFPEFTLVYLSNAQSPFELELTINKGRTEPYDLGNGYGHFAVVVDDLETEHARFEAQGLKPKKLFAMQREGQLIARAFFVEDPDGYKIEVLQNYGRFH